MFAGTGFACRCGVCYMPLIKSCMLEYLGKQACEL